LSSGYLLDTSVLSMLAPDRPAFGAREAEWFRRHAEDLHLTAIIIAEIEQGICKLHRVGGTERATRLATWLDRVLDNPDHRILAFDGRVARIAGALSDQALAAGRHPGFADIAVAATAVAYDLVLLTRNVRDFEPLGIAFADPFDDLP
jgi:hypothetical protein